MSTRTFILAVTGCAFIVAACGSYGTSVVEVGNTRMPVASVSVAVPLSLAAGQTARAVATPKDGNGRALTDRPVIWYTSSASIASVSDSGLISAVAPGTTVVSAVSEGVAGQATMAVVPPPPTPIAMVTVTVDPSAVLVGQTALATATLQDSSGTPISGRVITWSSSNTGISMVSASGLVTAIAAGSATITALSETKTGTAAITVSVPAPVPVASVSVSPSTATVQVGGTVQFSAVTRDANNNILTGRSISWNSNNVAVATVSASGLGTALAAGTVQITATSEGQSASATLTDTSPSPAPPPPSGTSNEPSGMTVISDRPFNALNELGWSDYFTGNMSFITDGTAPKSPSGVLRATYPTGFAGGSGVGTSILGVGNRRTIYFAYWAKLSANFWGHSSNTNKQAYFYTSLGTGVFFFAAYGAGSNPLEPVIQTQVIISPFGNGGNSNLHPNLVPGARIPRNQWYLIEIVAVGNTAGKVDGSIDWYLDGVHVGSYAIQWETGATTWGDVKYYNGWGGVGDTVPATMTVDWDHVYVSGKN